MNAVVQPNEPAIVPSIFQKVGELLGTPLRTEQDAFLLVAKGVRPKSYKLFIKRVRIPPSLIGSESTLRRRVKENEPFSTVESERMVRLSRVYVLALEAFGSQEAALEWLNTPGDWIPDEDPITPLQLASQEAGARIVEASIQKTLHGIF